MCARDLFTGGFAARFLKELCSALPTGRKPLERGDREPPRTKGSGCKCPQREEHSLCWGNSSTCDKRGGRARAVTTFLLFLKPGIISSWVSQSFDICCLRFFSIMSSLKKSKSLCSSNKGRFHHNKPRICNIKLGKLQATGSNRREIQSRVHSPPPDWCHCRQTLHTRSQLTWGLPGLQQSLSSPGGPQGDP